MAAFLWAPGRASGLPVQQSLGFTSRTAPAAAPAGESDGELPRSSPQWKWHGGTEGEGGSLPPAGGSADSAVQPSPEAGSSLGESPLPSLEGSDRALAPPGRCVRVREAATRCPSPSLRRPAPGTQVLDGGGLSALPWRGPRRTPRSARRRRR